MGYTWLSLPADVASLPEFTAFVRRGGREAGLPEAALGQLDLVVEEIVVNVARYAYPQNRPGTVAAGWTVAAPGRLEVEVYDSGIAYNPLEGAPPDLDQGLTDRPIGGLGVFLVKRLTDRVSYRREGDRNILTFSVVAN